MVLASTQEKAEEYLIDMKREPQNSQQVFTGTYDELILEQELTMGGVLSNPI